MPFNLRVQEGRYKSLVDKDDYRGRHSKGLPSFTRMLARRSRARIDERRKTLRVGGLIWPQIAEARMINVFGFHSKDLFLSMGCSNIGGSPAQSRIAPSI